VRRTAPAAFGATSRVAAVVTGRQYPRLLAPTSQPNSLSNPDRRRARPADHYIPGLTTEPAWPTLRAHLLNLAAETGEHPLRHLQTVAADRDLRTAGDIAAVLDWRLTAITPTDPGPLPCDRVFTGPPP
jgi:hypothetical protein